MLERTKLEDILERAGSLTIGLLGDLFLDRYLEISSGLHELSIETGLEAYQVERVRNVAGALGTIMNNLVALGIGKIVPVSVIGDDGHGHDLLRAVRAMPPVDARYILQTEQRLTPTYTKPLKPDASGTWHELNRLDVRSREPLPATVTDRLCEALRDVFHETDGMIVLDQVPETNCGVVNDRVRAELHTLLQNIPDKLVFIDSRDHIGSFRRGVLKGNIHELSAVAGLDERADGAAQRASATLAARTGQPVYCTLGERGLLVVQPDGSATLIETAPVAGPIDIVGAGDSATSAIVMSLLAGATHPEAAAVANLVASITIQQIGTTGTASPDQVLQRWDEVHS